MIKNTLVRDFCRTTTLAALLFGGWAGLELQAQSMRANATVTFLGDAKVHRFEGHGMANPTTVQWDQSQLTGEFQLSISGLNTQKDARDKEMRHMFEVDKHPIISAKFDHASVVLGSTLLFDLSIHGQTHRVQGMVTSMSGTDQEQKVGVQFDVSLNQYGLKAPSFLFGAISVKDIVKVDVDLKLTSN